MAASDNLNDQQFTAPEPTTEAPYSKFATPAMRDIGEVEHRRLNAMSLKQVVEAGDAAKRSSDRLRESGGPDPRDLRGRRTVDRGGPDRRQQ